MYYRMVIKTTVKDYMNDISCDYIYSFYKASHHLDRIKKLRKHQLIIPTQVQLDVTNECNQHCPYCIYRMNKNTGLNPNFNAHNYIPFKRMVNLLNELREMGVPAIQYTGGGEPMYHPNFIEILKETIDRDFDWSLVTNGVTDELDELIKYLKEATWIRVSVDASCAETYKKTHGTSVSDFDKVLNFIRTLVQETSQTTVGVSFLASPLNYKELIDTVKLFKDLGCANIRLSVIYTSRGIELYKKNWGEIVESAQKAKKLETDSFKVFDAIYSHLQNLDTSKRDYKFCGYQYFTAVIGADQEVYPCCTLKYDKATSFGNLKANTFKGVWFGKKHQAWLNSNYLQAVCDKHPCWMDSKNEFIGYLIKENPPHVNYI